MLNHIFWCENNFAHRIINMDLVAVISITDRIDYCVCNVIQYTFNIPVVSYWHRMTFCPSCLTISSTIEYCIG